MSAIPREKTMDGSLGLLRDGNLYITRRCERYKTDIFTTRLLLKKTFCIMGEEAAWVFYCKGRLTRRGAIPLSVLRLLQDKGSVATLDDKAHQLRKRMMMSLMTPERIQHLVDLVDERWRRTLYVWQAKGEVDLFDEVQRILCWAVYEWCGLGVIDGELDQRTREISAMIDGAGAIGPRNWRGTLLRRRTEKWITQKIKEERQKKLPPDQASPLHTIASHREAKGTLLPPEVAAVEVLNLLRPTVAVGRFILFAAIANAFSFIAQGGGGYYANHRCAGEQLTIALMKRCVHLLVNTMSYDVVAQDVEIDMHRMPALPRKPFLIRHVQQSVSLSGQTPNG